MEKDIKDLKIKVEELKAKVEMLEKNCNCKN